MIVRTRTVPEDRRIHVCPHEGQPAAVTTFFAAAGWFFLYQASAALHTGLG
jgi:hypothetical protein